MPRIPDSIKRPGQILSQQFGNKPGTLQTIYAHARELLVLQGQVRRLVPGNVYVATCEGATLHLITPSSALATRVRYNHRKLAAALQHEYPGIESIKISVRPDPVPQGPRLREPVPISPESAQHLESTAKYIEDDSLRKALIRLSNRAQKR